jgi:NADPH-dependent 2,4-dienoyl-CoA reductase/sulfur reductase-like enzyme
MDHTPYLILGTGPAGISAVEAIRKYDSQGRIVMVSSDSYPSLSPVLLTYWMGGHCSSEALRFRDTDWPNRFGVSLLPGSQATGIDGERKRVDLSDGRTIFYDRLLIATGASPILLPIPGHQTRGVAALRTAHDAESILRDGPPIRRVVIVGGGFIGIKLAFHLYQRGIDVSLFEKEPKLAPRMLDIESSQSIERTLRSHGVAVETGVEVEEILNDQGWVAGVRLKGGEVVSCERVVQAVGVRPNVGFLKDSGIAVQEGILADACMQTNLPAIYAAGDVAMTLDSITGGRISNATWPAATRQGKIAGSNMTGRRNRCVDNFPLNALHLFDLRVAAAGYAGDAEAGESERFLIDRTQGYRKVVMKDERITGFILMGDVRDAGLLLSRMKRPVSLSPAEIDSLHRLGNERDLPPGLGFDHGLYLHGK